MRFVLPTFAVYRRQGKSMLRSCQAINIDAFPNTPEEDRFPARQKNYGSKYIDFFEEKQVDPVGGLQFRIEQ